MTWNIYHLEGETLRALIGALDDLIPTEGTHGLGTQDAGDYVVVVAFQVGYGDWVYDRDGNVVTPQTMGRFVADIAVDADQSSLDLSRLESDNGWRTVPRTPTDYARDNHGARAEARRSKAFLETVSVVDTITVPRHSF